MTPTQRTYTDVETGYNCRLYTSKDASQYHLIYEGQDNHVADGSEVNGFYLAAHSGVTVKINGRKQINLSNGQFYHLKEGERATHRKFDGFPKFSKL